MSPNEIVPIKQEQTSRKYMVSKLIVIRRDGKVIVSKFDLDGKLVRTWIPDRYDLRFTREGRDYEKKD